MEGSTVEFQVNLPLGEAPQHAGHEGGAATGATGPGLAAASLPYAHTGVSTVLNIYELRVGAGWEVGMVLEGRSNLVEGKGLESLQIIDLIDGMGVAHRYTLAAPRAAQSLDGGDVWKDFRASHVDGHTFDEVVVAGLHLQDFDSCQSFEGELLLVGQMVVVAIFGHTAGGIAAHLGFAAVGIEHAHTEVAGLRGENQHQSVASDAEVAVGDEAGEGCWIRHLLLESVDVDIVVATSVHLGEFVLHKSLIFIFDSAKIGEIMELCKK